MSILAGILAIFVVLSRIEFFGKTQTAYTVGGVAKRLFFFRFFFQNYEWYSVVRFATVFIELYNFV